MTYALADLIRWVIDAATWPLVEQGLGLAARAIGAWWGGM